MSIDKRTEEELVKKTSDAEKDWKKRRTECTRRGYHVVEVEPENAKKVMECYECRIHFTKESASLYETSYRVESKNGRKNN
jgi:hypothetical protein